MVYSSLTVHVSCIMKTFSIPEVSIELQGHFVCIFFNVLSTESFACFHDFSFL